MTSATTATFGCLTMQAMRFEGSLDGLVWESEHEWESYQTTVPFRYLECPSQPISLCRAPEWPLEDSPLTCLSVDSRVWSVSCIPASLRTLRVMQLDHRNPEWLRKQTQITGLEIWSHVHFRKLEVPSLPQLTHLCLNRDIHNIEVLPVLTNLQSLEIVTNSINEVISHISGITSLTTLSLTTPPFRSLNSALQALTNLSSLRIVKFGRSLSSLPDWLSSMPSLTALSVSGPSIPPSVFTMTSLKILAIEGNRQQLSSMAGLVGLEVLSATLSEEVLLSVTSLPRLRTLVFDMGMKKLPDSMADMSALRELTISGSCSISGLDVLAKLTDLETLDLRQLRIARLPADMGAMRNLKKLLPKKPCVLVGSPMNESFSGLSSLQETIFTTYLPPRLGQLSALRKLELVGIKEVPDDLCDLSALTELRISALDAASLPEALGNLRNLRNLFLVGNFVLPKTICELSSLTTLYFSSTARMSPLPRDFGSLKQLRTLTLHYTHFPELPESLGHLSLLETLVITNCGISTMALPESFGGLTALQSLELKHNYITHLPDSFCLLPNLSYFRFHEALVKLPEHFGDLETLRCLLLDSSSLTALPASVTQLTNLRKFSLSSRVDFNYAGILSLPYLETVQYNPVEM